MLKAWILLLTLASGACEAGAWLEDILTFVDLPIVQPGCDIMFSPGAWCFPNPAPFVQSCCTPGFQCLPDSGSLFGNSCQQLPTANLSYSFEATYGKCLNKVAPGGQCGGGGGSCEQFGQCSNTGPWNGFCCPNGFSCQPEGQGFRVWTCQTDVTDAAPVAGDKEVLQYPPRKLPENACTCRVDGKGERVPTKCPSPWEHDAGTRKVPPPISVGAGGRFTSTQTGEDVVIRGINWFGWNVGQYNFDGLWAYCDDNYTASDPPCRQDGDIPPHFPEPAVGKEGVTALGGISFWGKRMMTNDFASVIYRMKLLGFNAVRIPFTFADLNNDIPDPTSGKTEFFPCMYDSDSYIAYKTMDPQLMTLAAQAGGKIVAPAYMGPQHPPPNDTSNQACNLPWEVPFAPSYKGGKGSLKLTMCNWYLPQGKGVPAIQRFLWQVQYIVSQGMYVVLSFSSGRDSEPNVASAALLTKNWQNLWKALRDLPQYKLLKGRVLADIANEPSRWGCQWDRPCHPANSTEASCAAGVWLYASAASGIHAVDPDVPVLIEGMGQDVQRGKYVQCAPTYYPGVIWGEGFITNGPTVSRYKISDPSGMFAMNAFKKLGPFLTLATARPPNQVVVSPHLYPRSITGQPVVVEADESQVTWKWDLSWGWKSLGIDYTSSGEPLRDIGLLIGEFGSVDQGDNSVNNTDTTQYGPQDTAWFRLLARYLNKLSWQNGPASWMWWSWNANSGDTKGLVGPTTTWREVQWTKIRLLIREFGLVPWYCTSVSPDFCSSVTWS